MRKSRMDLLSQEEFVQLIADSHSFAEVLGKMGYSKSGSIMNTLKTRIEKYGCSTEHFTRKTPINRTPENTFIENSTAAQRTVRDWYLKGEYTLYECSICGQPPIWNKKPLSLTLDHINGKNTDDRLENLRWVCPNCDRQLDTFGSKNKPGPVVEQV